MPRNHVRPTQEQVRQALFSILAQRIESARFLDLFAGSGAVGIEAWSRGAVYVEFVEKDRRVLDTLRSNVAALCPGQTTVVAMDASQYLKKVVADSEFDIIFCDPPYDDGCGDGMGDLLAGAGHRLSPRGVLVFEQSIRVQPVEGNGLRRVDERRYGETALWFYRRLEEQQESKG